MHKRWVSGFTIVEIIIVVVVIAILAVVAGVSYNGVTKSATTRAAQSDLTNVAAEMQRTILRDGAYPSTLSSSIKNSDGITLTLKSSGTQPFYTGLTAVQNGTLLAQICQNLVDEGAGRGTNQGGGIENYITGCGNWNYNSMQFTGWDSKVWNTPVTKDQLLTYANNFTTSDTWNKAQETVVRDFFNKLVTRQEQQGGKFPVTSFWDYWATTSNGGVMQQPLPTNTQLRSFYCVEAQGTKMKDIVWHVTETSRLESGSC